MRVTWVTDPHLDFVARMAPNLLVNTGDAVYRDPAVQETFELSAVPAAAEPA